MYPGSIQKLYQLVYGVYGAQCTLTKSSTNRVDPTKLNVEGVQTAANFQLCGSPLTLFPLSPFGPTGPWWNSRSCHHHEYTYTCG